MLAYVRISLMDEWDRQLREVHAGRREHLKTWNQLIYDLGAMTRHERVPGPVADGRHRPVAATAVRLQVARAVTS